MVLTGGLFVAGVILLFAYVDPLGTEYQDGDAWGVVLVAAVTLPLILRRRLPLAVGLMTAGAMLAFTIWDYAVPTAVVVIVVAIYSAGVYASLPRSLVVTAAHIGSTIAYVVASSNRHPGHPDLDVPNAMVNVLVLVGAWGVGRAVGNRRRYTAELEDRARRLERAGEAEVRAAIAEERSRIARELHDVVAHHVSVMTVQAAGARRSMDRDPQRSVEALLSVEETGRAALAEMRRVVGVLRGPGDAERSDEAELSPQPGLNDLAGLAEQMRAAGLPVDVTIDGEREPIPLGVDLTAYRVIQEALTNTIKHAGPSTAQVHVSYHSAELRVTVADNGHGIASVLDGRRQGHGLLGMRERVALYGGSVAVGPRRGGGFEVRVRIPYDNSVV